MKWRKLSVSALILLPAEICYNFNNKRQEGTKNHKNPSVHFNGVLCMWYREKKSPFFSLLKDENVKCSSLFLTTKPSHCCSMEWFVCMANATTETVKHTQIMLSELLNCQRLTTECAIYTHHILDEFWRDCTLFWISMFTHRQTRTHTHTHSYSRRHSSFVWLGYKMDVQQQALSLLHTDVYKRQNVYVCACVKIYSHKNTGYSVEINVSRSHSHLYTWGFIECVAELWENHRNNVYIYALKNDPCSLLSSFFPLELLNVVFNSDTHTHTVNMCIPSNRFLFQFKYFSPKVFYTKWL